MLDDALARISAPAASGAVKLRTAWWGTPARYATAAALVVGFGAAAMAAYHAHEADFARNTAGVGTTVADGTSVFRVTSPPHAAAMKTDQVASKTADAPVNRQAQANAAPPPTVAKQHRLAKKARIELLVRDVGASLKQAQAVVRAAGGDLVSLADSSPRTEDAIHDAKVEVEVPADRLESTLDRLGLLGTVQNRAIDAEDVAAKRPTCAS